MKQGLKIIFPTFFSMLNLLFLENISNMDVINKFQKIDLQTIGNILILIMCTYSIVCMVGAMRTSDKYLIEHCINIIFVIVSGFVLNVSIFENKIVGIWDFFTGWHAIWSICFIVMFLWFTGIGASAYELIKSIVQYVMDGVKCLIGLVTEAIKSTHRGIILAVSLGMIFWFLFLVIPNTGNAASIEILIKESIIFWCGWFWVCILISFFSQIFPKIAQAVNDMKNTNALKFFLWGVIGVVLLFVTIQVFPFIIPIIEGVISSFMTISLLAIALVYTEKEKLEKFYMINWKDLAIVLEIVVLVTFIFLPSVGGVTEEGKKILESEGTMDFGMLLELIIAGLELINKFL